MADETAEHVAAMEAAVDALMEQLGSRTSAEHLAAVLGAMSRREQSAKQLAIATLLTHSVADLAMKTDRGTNRLVIATWALAIGTLLLVATTAGLVYATLTAAPQIITVSRP